MQRYESYKSSGLDWLGEVPFHWWLKKSKFLWREKEDRSLLGDEELLSVSQYSGVVPRAEDSRSESLEDYKRCEPNDLVINIMLAWMSGLGVSKYSGIVSPAYCVYRQLENHNPSYFDYLYRAPQYLAEFARRSKGIVPSRWRMYTEDFGQILSLLPPREEQDRIVAFLDQKTAEIDAAIAKKERLIELLQEQKKTIRNQVITKGLNLSALQCDSGVPWIGAIPSHWKVCAIKRLFKSMDYGLSESALGDGDFKYLNMGHIKDGKVSTENTGYLASAPDALLLRKNDILFNRTNSFDLVGKSGIYLSDEENVTFASYMVRIRVKDEICPSWANSLMNSESYLSFIRTLALRSLNQANLNPTRLGAVSVPVPPKEEQEAIADYLDGMSTQVDISIRSIEKELCGLFEMKQTTIANVITGKIKV